MIASMSSVVSYRCVIAAETMYLSSVEVVEVIYVFYFSLLNCVWPSLGFAVTRIYIEVLGPDGSSLGDIWSDRCW